METLLFVTKEVTQVSASDLEGVGRVRWKDGKCYRWVKNGEAATAFAIGSVVTHKYGDDADTFKTAYAPATANLSLLAGVCISAIPAQSYGWIQIWGYNAVTSVRKENSDGADLALGDALVGVDGVLHANRAAAAGAAAHPRHVVVAASVAKQTGSVASAVVTTKSYVRCL